MLRESADTEGSPKPSPSKVQYMANHEIAGNIHGKNQVFAGYSLELITALGKRSEVGKSRSLSIRNAGPSRPQPRADYYFW